ncbi:hypothetical protein IFM12276_09680 [Nocardia sputorum]|uniref:Uncharacterized protein n=1 Tax=Nocardia sputorum TaxID=2984338 RepID=A0ABN6TYD1_9NOCA|nr:hypothetical protein IFM12276_09680 [Nocardia sputorum]
MANDGRDHLDACPLLGPDAWLVVQLAISWVALDRAVTPGWALGTVPERTVWQRAIRAG